MSSTMKISLLALASTVIAIPHYGANPHSKFHSVKASGTNPTGKPYPSGGWSGNYNSTAVPHVAETGSYAYDDGKTTTLDITSTSTQTVYSTVVVKPSASASASASTSAYQATGVVAENVSTDKCGPATITVTASDKITVTVTAGDAYTPAPASSSAAPSSKAASSYKVASSYKAVVEKASSTVVYSAATPEAATSTTPAAAYSATTPKVEKTSSSKVVSYIAPSYAQNVAASSTVSSAYATASATGNTYSGVKRGLAYNEASLCSTFGSKFGFGYNWGQVENNDIGTNFIPMMHKPSDSTAEDWLANVDKAVKKGSTAVMGFNECDQDSQCNLGVDAACTAWKSYMNPIKASHPDVTIIGPSVTNGGEANKGLSTFNFL